MARLNIEQNVAIQIQFITNQDEHSTELYIIANVIRNRQSATRGLIEHRNWKVDL